MSVTPNVVYMKFGSHLYGLDTPSSDVDYKGIFLPTLPELLLGNHPNSIVTSTGGDHSKNTNKDTDVEIVSLPRFIKHACDGETYALDMLHCSNPLSDSDIWKDLISKRKKFYSKNMKAYVGYVKKQAAKYGLKGSRLHDIKQAIEFLSSVRGDLTLADLQLIHAFPEGEFIHWTTYTGKGAGAVEQLFWEVNGKKYQSTNTVEYTLKQLIKMYDGYGERAKMAEANEGIDWKAVSHALRAGFQARDIYLTGDFEYPLKETDFLLKVKTGQLDYKTEVAPILESLVEEVNEYAENCAFLPSKVDRSKWGEWLLDVYSYVFDIPLQPEELEGISFNI